MRRGILLALALSTFSSAQDEGHSDYKKCTLCRNALAKAMTFVKAEFEKTRLHGAVLPRILGGFAFMLNGGYKAELDTCVKYARNKLEAGPGTDMGNWAIGLSLLFLCEYSLRFGQSPDIDSAIDRGLKRAEAGQEKSGGWCHDLGYAARIGYLAKNGASSLGVLTAIMYASFVEAKSLGRNPGPMMERARKYLESLFDATGLVYGPDNRYADHSFSRAAWLLWALPSTDPLHPKIVQGVTTSYKLVERAHACGSLHYLSLGVAMHRLGPEHYLKCSGDWIHALIARQQPDGSVPMFNDLLPEAERPKVKGDAASTSVFACLVMMQREGLFRPRIKFKNR